MSRGSKLAVAIALVLIFYAVLCIWWANSRYQPYERPPAHTKAEARIVKKALRRHGISHLITTETKIYFEREGKEILIARRAL